MGISKKIVFLKDIFTNIFSDLRYELSYIVEPAEWSIKLDGEYITSRLNKHRLMKARITTHHFGLRNQILHFGSVNTFLVGDDFYGRHKSNRIVLTWFHVIPQDSRIELVRRIHKYIDIIHTSSNSTRRELIKAGLPSEKIIIIRLGVDLNLFKPISVEEKQEERRKLNIPEGRVLIGSFQKDGVGWRSGMRPKFIKGPDIFIKVVEKLKKKFPIFVLLIGPARGYIIKELEQRNIPYKYVGHLRVFSEIAKYYRVLDLYLITSRVEGGPKQILEAWASGVPVVSTKVGMISDIGVNNKNILLAEIEDIREIVKQAEKMIKNSALRKKIIENGLENVQNYSWDIIAQKYYKKIYSQLL